LASHRVCGSRRLRSQGPPAGSRLTDVRRRQAPNRRRSLLAAGPLGRKLRHLVVTIEDLAAAGVAFVSMGECIDTTSPTGRLMLGILGSFAQFERERIRERIHAGLARARRQGQKLGRRRKRISERDLQAVASLSVRDALSLKP
jgi:hypothetical protein